MRKSKLSDSVARARISPKASICSAGEKSPQRRIFSSITFTSIYKELKNKAPTI
jgi:hypothetical protein